LLGNLASQVRSNSSDSHQMSTRTASDGVSVRQGVQRSHLRHQQDLCPKLPIPRKDHIYVNLLESTIEKEVGCPISLCFYKSTEDGQAASFLSEEIAYYLERRVPFRRIKQLLLRELRTDYVEGVRVNCSGRVGGRSKKAQRARGERFQWGQTSSHVFSSRLSFASRSALTSFGKVGIKVWICYKQSSHQY
jgi:ribosomal protein S3